MIINGSFEFFDENPYSGMGISNPLPIINEGSKLTLSFDATGSFEAVILAKVNGNAEYKRLGAVINSLTMEMLLDSTITDDSASYELDPSGYSHIAIELIQNGGQVAIYSRLVC